MPDSTTGTAVIFHLAGRQDRQYHYVSTPSNVPVTSTVLVIHVNIIADKIDCRYIFFNHNPTGAFCVWVKALQMTNKVNRTKAAIIILL